MDLPYNQNNGGTPKRPPIDPQPNLNSLLRKLQLKSHDQLVADLANALTREGLTVIKIALPGYPCPEKVGRHEPDIIAVDSSGLWHIGEAKTADDIGTTHSQEQLQDFIGAYMSNDRRPVQVHVVVPKGELPRLNSVLSGLNLMLPNVKRWFS